MDESAGRAEIGGHGRVPHGEPTRRPLRGARLRQLLRLAAQRGPRSAACSPSWAARPPAHQTRSSDGFHASPQRCSVSAVTGTEPIGDLPAAPGVDPAARRAWHRYFRDARAADDLYAELDTGLPVQLADRPLLTIFGQFNDPLRFKRRWRALNPNVHQVKVPRGNHFPMCDNPELVASALTDFAAQPDHR